VSGPLQVGHVPARIISAETSSEGNCLANFARCREAHRVVTGSGWALVGAASLAGALLGRPTLGEVRIAFVVVAVLGHDYEGVWRAARGTNALHL
jgi:hypothetical protein